MEFVLIFNTGPNGAKLGRAAWHQLLTLASLGQPNEKWINLTTHTTLAAAVADKTFLIKSDELHQNTVQGSGEIFASD